MGNEIEGKIKKKWKLRKKQAKNNVRIYWKKKNT